MPPSSLTIPCPLCGDTIDDIPQATIFDGITAFDVLEHVLDPNAFLHSVHGRLNDGGHMVLTGPDTGGIVRRLMGRRWYFYFPEEHLHYFNGRNLSDQVRKHGFEVVDVGATCKPMTYDYAYRSFMNTIP